MNVNLRQGHICFQAILTMVKVRFIETRGELMKYTVKDFFDTATFTWTYVVYDDATKDAVIIDPVLDYEPVGSEVGLNSFNTVTDFVDSQGFKVHYILETHAHADHLSASQFLKQKYPQAKIAISEEIKKVQKTFKDILQLHDTKVDGSQFDELLTERQIYHAGSIEFEMFKTPGHTPACSTLKFDKAVFVGDAMFLPDIGTGRCDFPEGSAENLYDSIQSKIYSLSDDTLVYVGHDYPPAGVRKEQSHCTVLEAKTNNKQLKANTSKEEFLKFRIERDKVLKAPRLLYQSLQVNINAGQLPAGTDNFFKLPVNKTF